jgi:hypothetical protein
MAKAAYLWAEILRTGEHAGYSFDRDDIARAGANLRRAINYHKAIVPTTWEHPRYDFRLGDFSRREMRQAVEMSTLDDLVFGLEESGNPLGIFGRVVHAERRGNRLFAHVRIPDPNAAEEAATWPGWSPGGVIKPSGGMVIRHVSVTKHPAQRLGKPLALSLLDKDRKRRALELSTLDAPAAYRATERAVDRAVAAAASSKHESVDHYLGRRRRLLKG